MSASGPLASRQELIAEREFLYRQQLSQPPDEAIVEVLDDGREIVAEDIVIAEDMEPELAVSERSQRLLGRSREERIQLAAQELRNYIFIKNIVQEFPGPNLLHTDRLHLGDSKVLQAHTLWASEIDALLIVGEKRGRRKTGLLLAKQKLARDENFEMTAPIFKTKKLAAALDSARAGAEEALTDEDQTEVSWPIQWGYGKPGWLTVPRKFSPLKPSRNTSSILSAVGEEHLGFLRVSNEMMTNSNVLHHLARLAIDLEPIARASRGQPR